LEEIENVGSKETEKRKKIEILWKLFKFKVKIGQKFHKRNIENDLIFVCAISGG